MRAGSGQSIMNANFMSPNFSPDRHDPFSQPSRRCVVAVKTEVFQADRIAGAGSIDRKETKAQREHRLK
jgi:hypothetical protein